ncbi:hypothetical protein [Oleiagrimonas soli]|uniref:Uncharacterized protein n=1 Tax=Oleiagrimonas soli TaxID=1543381 RepID=A0A099CRL3_9GAMM|nr:hypothetical protein [Oleiagrimonas soli]KGI76633.1 hypothetical protein LF63_0114920 [Oleiagrimonas soli]MBB6184921.1 hypothetical protein [Oleiagrimonas soli]
MSKPGLSGRKLLVAALTALLATGAAFADDGGSATTTNDTTASARMVTQYSTLAGSDSNAQALIDGLRKGTDITLSTDTTASDGSTTSSDTTFTPATGAMGYGNVNISLALAQADLAAAGITDPTADQLEAALNGGTVTLSDGSTVDLQGVLALRASGQGWGQIAKALGVNLGAVVSASHTTHSRAGMTHGKPDSVAAKVSDHANSMASANHPSRPDIAQRPDRPERPQRPDLPDHAGRPGG